MALGNDLSGIYPIYILEDLSVDNHQASILNLLKKGAVPPNTMRYAPESVTQ